MKVGDLVRFLASRCGTRGVFIVSRIAESRGVWLASQGDIIWNTEMLEVLNESR